MNELFLEISKEILITIILGVLSILFFVKPFAKHKELYAKTMKLKRDFKDPNNFGVGNLTIMGKQFEDLKEIKSIPKDIDKYTTRVI